MKKNLLLVMMLSFIFVACQKDAKEEFMKDLENNNQNQIAALDADQEFFSIDEINAIMEKRLSETGSFNWNDETDELVWSAIFHANGTAELGYSDVKWSAVKDSKLASIKNDIIDFIYESDELSSKKMSKQDVIYDDDDFFTHMGVKILNFETFKQLRHNKNVRFLEPGNYTFYNINTDFGKGIFGCNTETQYIYGNDLYAHPNSSKNIQPIDPDGSGGGSNTVYPNSPYSWVFKEANIDDVWSLGYTGDDVTIGVIDTGVNTDNEDIYDDFNISHSRWISAKSTHRHWTIWGYVDDPAKDECGHGTQITATIGAPYNTNRKPIGVAYESNMIVYRACNAVLLSTTKRRSAVKRAYQALADVASVKVISMSMGSIEYHSYLADAVSYADSKGKLMVCAAGTSTNVVGNDLGIVVYPASDYRTIAVSGITDNTSRYDMCSNCHWGSSVDIVVTMEREVGGNWDKGERTSPVIGYGTGEKRYFGGSSVATAITAGVSALIWDKNSTLSAAAVKSLLISNCDAYPSGIIGRGMGRLDAKAAIDDTQSYTPPPPSFSASISGPITGTEGGTYTWTASSSHATGSVTYKWYTRVDSSGGYVYKSTGSSFTRTLSPYYFQSLNAENETDEAIIQPGEGHRYDIKMIATDAAGHTSIRYKYIVSGGNSPM